MSAVHSLEHLRCRVEFEKEIDNIKAITDAASLEASKLLYMNTLAACKQLGSGTKKAASRLISHMELVAHVRH